MIKQEDIFNLMKSSNSPYWKLKTIDGTTLGYNLEEKDMSRSIATLKERITMFSSYSLIVWAGTESVKNAQFKGSQKWNVASENPSVPQNSGLMPNGYVPESVMLANVQMATMLAENKFEMYKLREEMKGSKNQLIPDKYVPFICKLFGMPIEEIIELGAINHSASTTGLAGTEEKDIEVEEVEKTMENLCSEKNVGLSKLMKLLKALEKNPKLADTLIPLIK